MFFWLYDSQPLHFVFAGEEVVVGLRSKYFQSYSIGEIVVTTLIFYSTHIFLFISFMYFSSLISCLFFFFPDMLTLGDIWDCASHRNHSSCCLVKDCLSSFTDQTQYLMGSG